MKRIMSIFQARPFIITGMAILLLGSPALLWSTDEFSRVKNPNDRQQCVLLGLEREIAAVQADIQTYYRDLLDDPCSVAEGGDPTALSCKMFRIDKKTGWTIVPLTSDRQSYYGRRTRFYFTQNAYVRWTNDGKVQNFLFEQKRTKLGTGYTIIKTLGADASIIPGIGVKREDKKISIDVDECLKMKPEDRDSGTKPLNLFVKEVLSSGQGGTFTFRFPTDKDGRVVQEDKEVDGKLVKVPVRYVRDKTEEITVDGGKKKVRIVYVRDPAQRISITREYLRLLKLTLRRIDWNARGAAQRKAREIERILGSK